MSDIQLTIVVDNHSEKDLGCEHGYCLHIDDGRTSLLLDTGQSKLLISNSEKLDIDLKSIQHLVLSHGHYDHTGGISHLVAINPQIAIHLHRDCRLDRFSRDPERVKAVGIEKKAHEALQNFPKDQLYWIDKPTNITDKIHLTGPVPRNTSFETTGGDFFLDRSCTGKDYILDDQSLFIETDSGLVICLGCCHSGIINTLDYIRELYGEAKIAAIIGGMHLVNNDNARLEKTVSKLKQFDIDLIVACHCTGDEASRYLQDNLSTPVKIGYSGFSMSF